MKNEENNQQPNQPFDNHLTSPLHTIKDNALKLIQQISSNVISAKQCSIDEYMASKSKELDTVIINLEKNGYLKYIAGEISAIHDGNGNFHIEGDFYFRDRNNQLFNHKITGKSIRMEWALTPEEQHRLAKENKITYDYEKP